jgi:hypothetical protein
MNLDVRTALISWETELTNPRCVLGGDATPIQKGLARRPRTWAEFAKNSDWSKALA